MILHHHEVFETDMTTYLIEVATTELIDVAIIDMVVDGVTVFVENTGVSIHLQIRPARASSAERSTLYADSYGLCLVLDVVLVLIAVLA